MGIPFHTYSGTFNSAGIHAHNPFDCFYTFGYGTYPYDERAHLLQIVCSRTGKGLTRPKNQLLQFKRHMLKPFRYNREA
jgi:hypothetical protein